MKDNGMSEAHVRGATVLSTKQFLVDRFGAEAFGKILGLLPREHRAVIAGRVAMESWQPFAAWVALSETIDRTFGTGDLSLCRELGRWSAEKDLGTMYRPIVAAGNTSVLSIVRLAPELWGLYYDSGRVELQNLQIDPERPGSFELVVIDFAEPHLVHCLRIAGWLEGALDLAGTVAEVEIIACRARGDLECRTKVHYDWRR
jgi:hypothetical protein